MRGEGEMLLTVRPETEAAPKSTEITPSEMLYKLLEDAKEEKARLLSIIESQQRTIEMLAEQNKKAAAQPENNAGCVAAV